MVAPSPVPQPMPSRRGPWLAVVIVLGVAIAGLWWLNGEIRNLTVLADQSPAAAEQRLLALAERAFAIPSALLAITALFMARLAWRGWHTATFPPAGAWLLRETEVVTGRAARWRAGIALLVALLTIAMAVWLPREVLKRIEATVEHAREQRAPIEWNRP